MHGQILWAIALVIATTFVHAGCTGLLLQHMGEDRISRWATGSRAAKTLLITSVVVALFIAALLEAAIWAATYLYLGVLTSFEQAFYFSLVTFTTLGYGDITPAEHWRLLASIEAVNGIILFGWSTALVFAFVQHMIHQLRSEDDAS